MHKSDLRRWISSRFASSWQLALMMFINYPLTGAAFGNLPPYKNGPMALELDIVFGATAAAGVLGFGWLCKRLIRKALVASLAGWLLTSILANASHMIWLWAFYPMANPIELWPQALTGWPQTFTILLGFTMLIASFSESRSATKSLGIQRAKLNYLTENLKSQIAEIESRLRTQVREKLDSILATLNKKIAEPVAANELATDIEVALNAGVRPLSWEIESEVADLELKPVALKRLSLAERLAFPTTIRRSLSLAVLLPVIAVFDLPATAYVFGPIAVFQVCIVLAVLAGVFLGLKKIIGDKTLPAWVVVVGMTLIAGLVSMLFVLLRFLNQELSAELTELAIVFSFCYITLMTTTFSTVINRKIAQIDAEREVNEQLELLVANLRQAVWVAKKKLARLVHGPVQSELFAAYLALSQNAQLSANQLEGVKVKILHVAASLDEADANAGTIFEKQISDLLSGWGQVLDIDFETEESLLKQLSPDAVASACVLEVLTEAITNAAKHGAKNTLKIKMKIIDTRFVELKVTNPIDAKGKDSEEGYGSKILDDVTHSWSLKTENDQAVFTALVALSESLV